MKTYSARAEARGFIGLDEYATNMDILSQADEEINELKAEIERLKAEVETLSQKKKPMSPEEWAALQAFWDTAAKGEPARF